jgi:hypothetical protein
LIVITILLYWLLTDDGFRVTAANVSFEGLRHADETEVRARLTDIDREPNVFRVRATDIVAELSTLTEVDAAYATVSVPGNVAVHLDERDPVFVWSNGGEAWLVDEEGMLFAPAPSEEAGGAGAEATPDDADQPDEAGAAEALGREARAALPEVFDTRLPAEPPTVGTFLPDADLEVMGRLLAITPELLGSRSTSLRLRVDENDGYVLEADSDLVWQAVFGHYLPSIQPVEVLPRQVQCLEWLLAQEERKLERVRLSLSEDSCGTYTKFGARPRKDG